MSSCPFVDLIGSMILTRPRILQITDGTVPITHNLNIVGKKNHVGYSGRYGWRVEVHHCHIRPWKCIWTVLCFWCVQTTIDSVLEDWSWLLSFVSLASPFYSVRGTNIQTHTHTHTAAHTWKRIHTQNHIIHICHSLHSGGHCRCKFNQDKR